MIFAAEVLVQYPFQEGERRGDEGAYIPSLPESPHVAFDVAG